MKPLHLLLLMSVLGVSAARAQENAPMIQKPSSLEQNSGSGTAPRGQGSTGWTGGTGGSFIGTQHQGAPSFPNSSKATCTR